VSAPRTRGNGVRTAFAAIGAALIACSSAEASAPHVVAPGETLWSISAANNLTTRTVAVYNGLPEDAALVAGTTIHVPTVAESAAALSTGTAAASTPATVAGTEASATGTAIGTGTGITPAPGMGHVPSPYGDLHLAPAAAESWNAMRAESLELYGVDLYPGGTLSAYRTYEQQAALYEAYMAGVGSPANPPGTSSHELGTAVDLETPEMRWVIDQIGWKYGWGKVHGPDEWWHVDYVGG
jgi:LAS superfamily LD-carboxypeptidase LdcB